MAKKSCSAGTKKTTGKVSRVSSAKGAPSRVEAGAVAGTPPGEISGDARSEEERKSALLAALVGIVGAVGVMKYGKAISDFFSSLGDKTAEVTPKK